MKRHTFTRTTLMIVALLTWTYGAAADQRQTFGYAGAVDSFNRGGGTVVVGDLVFHISEATLVHKDRGHKGTLSDIVPGTKVGFYPASGKGSYLNEIWILPRNWKGETGFAHSQDN